MVAINEIIIGVNIALTMLPESACGGVLCEHPPVDIDCLLGWVNNGLRGCPMAPGAADVIFNGEANRLHAYQQTNEGLDHQIVIPSHADAPENNKGRDINGQICFTRGPAGQVRMIAGEDTNQRRGHAVAGWGLFELTGTGVDLDYQQIGKLIPTYQMGGDDAENYGCGFLSDGRLVTTDVGAQAAGNGNGQLIVWFPPFDTGVDFTDEGVLPLTPIKYCKLDVRIGTAQQIAIDDQDRIYVSSSRPNGYGDPGGVYRYTGPFPTSDRPEDGCDGIDGEGSPMATGVNKELFIPAGTTSSLATPAGIVIKPDGGFYVASVLTGIIAEYDHLGQLLRRVLDPPPSGLPIATGTPLGLGLGSDGSLYFADIGLVANSSCGICPGDGAGTVRRIRFVNGEPQQPEILRNGLDFPDGIGILKIDRR
jgi:hypothetical protein